MDWARARAILIVAFAVVNVVLGYSLWGSRSLPALAQPSGRVQVEQVRSRLLERNMVLPPGVLLPPTPAPMHFLRVEYRPNLKLERLTSESYQRPIAPRLRPLGFDGTSLRPEPTLEPETHAVIYRPAATGLAARKVDLGDKSEIGRVAEEYLRAEALMPDEAFLSGIFVKDQQAVVEFVPMYHGTPVYSGFSRVELTERGIEAVTQFWVEPIGFKESAPKAVRPASEALLRLAGHLERSERQVRTILDVRLGYYAGRSLTVTVPDAISAWETVPVWRITLDNGSIYYINAFNGELES